MAYDKPRPRTPKPQIRPYQFQQPPRRIEPLDDGSDQIAPVRPAAGPSTSAGQATTALDVCVCDGTSPAGAVYCIWCGGLNQ